MSTRAIRTSAAELDSTCDVCGRTLLRGERAHPFLEGTELRSVCELCTQRAAQEGWVREGTVPVYEGRGSRSEGRGSLLGRLRRRGANEHPAGGHPSDSYESATTSGTEAFRGEPRHVRAVPTGADQKVSAAIDAFNHSEHPRTVAGVSRSLGLPSVSVQPVPGRSTVVNVVVAWELSWYRYEVDLAEQGDAVQLGAQGTELAELTPEELEANATCDPHGYLLLA